MCRHENNLVPSSVNKLAKTDIPLDVDESLAWSVKSPSVIHHNIHTPNIKW